jgi:hypothetical protein
MISSKSTCSRAVPANIFESISASKTPWCAVGVKVVGRSGTDATAYELLQEANKQGTGALLGPVLVLLRRGDLHTLEFGSKGVEMT